MTLFASRQLEDFVGRGFPTPYLVVDLDIVRADARAMLQAFPKVECCYAIKANHHPDVLRALWEVGVSFDVASVGEIAAASAVGAPGSSMSFGNTAKPPAAIRRAVEAGIDRFAFDCLEELDKLSDFAPGSLVMARLQVSGAGAAWPLSRKFGRYEPALDELLAEAARRGHRCGVTFHVGSQQLLAEGWDEPIAAAARLARGLERAGGRLDTLNLGGGFGSAYLNSTAPAFDAYGAAVMHALDREFGTAIPSLMAEPGRALVARAGVIDASVILVSHREDIDVDRWVFVDVGVATGLVETAGSIILFPVSADRSGSTSPAIVAGPTCDSVDVLYDDVRPMLPDALAVGDHLYLHQAGAYTFVNSTIGFNGFDPLPVYVVEAGQ